MRHRLCPAWSRSSTGGTPAAASASEVATHRALADLGGRGELVEREAARGGLQLPKFGDHPDEREVTRHGSPR